MPESDWESQFDQIFRSGIERYRAGQRNPQLIFQTREQAFLATIGCRAEELFRFVEDHVAEGAPDVRTVREIAAIRRRYFLEVQHGIPSQFHVDPHELPAAREALDGIRWLPRIIAKARAKLLGELEPSTTYGCDGDQAFVESIGMSLPQFLQLVWDSEDDEERILSAVKASVSATR